MSKKPTYNDFRDGRPKELMETYKINHKELEMAQRDVNYGANQAELRKEYDKFYKRNRNE
jgi:hypothetical protein